MASYGAPKRSAASPEPGPYTMTQPMGQICIADGDNHPKYKGVRKRKWGKWVSEVRLPNSRERIWLGSFDTPQKAARAFDAAQFCLRGRCARFNFPDDPPDIPGGESLNPREIQVVAAKFANESSTCTADHHHQQQQEDIDRYYHTNYNAIINTNENSSSSWQEPSQNPNHHDQYQPYCHRNVDSSASFITNSAHGDMDWSFLNSIDESGATSANNYDNFDTLFGGQLYGHQMHYYSGNEFCPPPPPAPPGSDSIREDNQINGEQQYSSFLWNF